jgi:tyrosinase
MYTRTNVYANGGDFSDPIILWYARGVAAMQKLALSEPTSWGFYAAIHGFNVPVWDGVSIPTAPLPSNSDQKTYWKQCQHGTWYFLPWHRGYLLGLEAVVRSHIVAAGGPSDWALPYWNYFDPNENKLPPAFASATWPDGGANPLFTTARYGPNGDGEVYVELSEVNEDALNLHNFVGTTRAAPGFGGVDTGFSHGTSLSIHGALESQPHDQVHGLVGGQQGNAPNGLPGWMSDPTTAGFDPIFWLHHANIDRLWVVWNAMAVNTDPTDAKWVNGPASIGERKFTVPMPGGVDYVYTPGMVVDTTALGYTYTETTPSQPAATLVTRLQTLGLVAPAAVGAGAPSMDKKAELVGATQGAIPLEGAEIRATVAMDSAPRKRVIKSLSAVSADAPEPDRVYLHLENIRGTNDATRLAVYVDAPQGAEYVAGHVALFGVREASEPDGGHAGHGLSLVLDITNAVDQMHLKKAFDVDHLSVRIVPNRPITKDEKISIGRISIYREGF